MTREERIRVLAAMHERIRSTVGTMKIEREYALADILVEIQDQIEELRAAKPSPIGAAPEMHEELPEHRSAAQWAQEWQSREMHREGMLLDQRSLVEQVISEALAAETAELRAELERLTRPFPGATIRERVSSAVGIIDEMQRAIMRLPEPQGSDGPEERVGHALAEIERLKADCEELRGENAQLEMAVNRG